MTKNPILEVSLCEVMRPEIALPLQHILKIHTVGSFLNAWRSPKNQKSMEQLFDSPEQARHAAAICAAWLGVPTAPAKPGVSAWWRGDDIPAMPAAAPIA